jgi:hypothetical protein
MSKIGIAPLPPPQVAAMAYDLLRHVAGFTGDPAVQIAALRTAAIVIENAANAPPINQIGTGTLLRMGFIYLTPSLENPIFG